MPAWRHRLTLIQGDITVQDDVDVIVNAANESLRPGGGVCGAIHAAAGRGLARECAAIGYCATGEAVATRAHDLPCQHVIHTVGPVWSAGAGEQEDALLASCYRESILLAAELGCARIAFPSISTGIFGFPLDRAARVALGAIVAALADRADVAEVRMVCFSAEDLAVYESALAEMLA